jgi:hypothetical protein
MKIYVRFFVDLQYVLSLWLVNGNMIWLEAEVERLSVTLSEQSAKDLCRTHC